MNGMINQRFVVAFFSKEDGGHCDSESWPKRQEAIDYAKAILRREFEKHKSVLYAEISNHMNSKQEAIVVELFEVGDRIYVWDPHHLHLQSGGYQGGRAHGVIKEINGMKAKIKYYDMDELIEELLTDLRPT